VIDVAVDANRDGVVNAADPADQDRETEWAADVGASFMANLDDDDSDGVRDSEDEIVNGEADLLDLATIAVSGWPTADAGAHGVLSIDAESAENVRIFKLGTFGTATLVLGSIGPCTSPTDCTYTLSHKLTPEETIAGVSFGIEARRFRGMPLASLDPGSDMHAKKLAWTGYVDLSYIVADAADTGRFTSEENPDGVDAAKIRVAPWLLLGSLGAHDTMYSSNASPAFVGGNTTAAQEAGVAYTPYGPIMDSPGGWQDIWTEDFFQTGWTGFPGPDGTMRSMRIFNARPWGRPPFANPTPEQEAEYAPIRWILGNREKNRPPAVLAPDRGGAAFYDPEHEGTGHTQDSHGNHDVVPPFPGYSMGRIIHGNKVMAETTEFYASQGVQGPPIVLDTTWLAVEHVDEFFHWVPSNTPRGWKLLVASPALMTKMLQDMKAAGNGAAVLHAGRGGNFEKTIDQALADPDLTAWSQTADVKILGHIETMKAETGLTDADIIMIPTWFEDLGVMELVAWNPGMVNMRMLGNVASVAKPFGPLIGGADPFEADFLARLGGPESQLGSDGQGLKIFFTDDWYYHEALGEVHCGTNESAVPHAGKDNWWESGR
jgi:protein-arginine deiminase